MADRSSCSTRFLVSACSFFAASADAKAFAIWQGESAVDFSLGFISAFVPFCAFAYIVFFRKQDFSTKLTAFYRGEALKFMLTIVLVGVSFKWLAISHFILFFVGFFTALALNNVIPFLLNRS